MGDSDDGGGLSPVRRRVRPVGGHPVTHAAKTMLPKLRIILAAVFATCAAVLALSAGVLGRAPGRRSRRRAGGQPHAGAAGDRRRAGLQQSQLLAYSRRADELLRLRDLPVTPARAVVDYAERAQARAAETASAPAAPAATSPTDRGGRAPCRDAARRGDERADADRGWRRPTPAADSARPRVTPPTDAPPPAMVAWRRSRARRRNAVRDPGARRRVARRPPQRRHPTDRAGGDAGVSAAAPRAIRRNQGRGCCARRQRDRRDVWAGKPNADGKPRHRARIVHPHPPKAKKKTQVAAARLSVTRAARPRPRPASRSNQPNNRNNAVGGWRSYDSTAR